MKKILLLLVTFVLTEIAIFILIGNWIGVLFTLLCILVASIVGVAIAKKQGLKSIHNIQQSVSQGIPPGHAMLDAFLVFIGGIMFLLPGFISDLIGFSLVLPWTRSLYKPFLYNWIRKKMKNGQVIIVGR